MGNMSIKWLDDRGKEVEPGQATHALITEYDREGKVVRETEGTLGEGLDNWEVEERA